MSTPDQDRLLNHRRQRSLITAFSLLVLVLAIAPRQERALFITDATALKGFSAIVPPVDYASLARIRPFTYPIDDIGPRGFFARTPGRPRGATPGPVTPADVGETPATPFTPSEEPLTPGQGPVLQNAATPAFPDTPGGGFPFTPASLTPPASSPGAPIDGPTPPTTGETPAPVATPTPPVVAPTPTPTPTTAPPDVTAAVPEPGTWALLIFGFFAAGGLLRRKRDRAMRAPDARAI